MTGPDHERYAEDIAPYLLGALAEVDRSDLERHLATCEQCRQELDLLRPAAEALSRSAEPLVPPASLKRSVMRTVREEAGARRAHDVPATLRRLAGAFSIQRPALAWISAAFLLALGMAAGFGLSNLGEDDSRVYSAQVDRARVPHGSASLLVVDEDAAGAVLRVHGMPQPVPNQVYQTWVSRHGEIVPASLFTVGPDGAGAAAIPVDLEDVDEVMVTRERRAGARSPSGPPILRVRLS